VNSEQGLRHEKLLEDSINHVIFCDTNSISLSKIA
jgi:hypothetical protein